MEKKTRVVIIGAGPSGLAAGACLKKAGIDAEIIEKENQVGSSWRHHYERLHLHTTKSNSALPHMMFPKNYPRYVSRNLFIQYLESYMKEFDLQPNFSERVVSVSQAKDEWLVQTDKRLYRSQYVIMASGQNACPNIPTFKKQDEFRGQVLHCSRYLNPKAFKGQEVLIVGMGNSGAEIALDLAAAGVSTSLCVRSQVHIVPRELFGLPIQDVAILSTKILPPRMIDKIFSKFLRVVLGDLNAFGLREPRKGILQRCRELARTPVIDVGTLEKIKSGAIKILPGISEFYDSGILFEDQTQKKFDSVILATGYSHDLKNILSKNCLVLESDHVHAAAAAKGLYFIGFHSVITGVLREISLEAEKVSRQIISSISQK